jgi:hypothetical protein
MGMGKVGRPAPKPRRRTPTGPPGRAPAPEAARRSHPRPAPAAPPLLPPQIDLHLYGEGASIGGSLTGAEGAQQVEYTLAK